jgi:hypothetical protein
MKKFKVGDTISCMNLGEVKFVWQEGGVTIGLVDTEEELRVYTSPQRGHHIEIIDEKSYFWSKTLLTERCSSKLFDSNRRLIIDKNIIRL